MAGEKARIGVRLDGDESGLAGAFNRASAKASAFASKMRGIGKGLGAAFTGAAVLGMAKSIIGNSDRIADLAANVGLTTDELQAFEGIAREAGTSTEKLGASLEKLAMVQGNIAAGDGDKAAKALEALGISAEDANAPVGELFQKIADGFAKTGDVGALDELFGRGSVQLSNTLRQIASFGSLESLTAAMRASGNVLSPGELSRLATVNDKAADLANKAAVRIAGTFTPGVDDPTANDQQKAAIDAQRKSREQVARAAREATESAKRAELEKIISGAKGPQGLGSELVRIGARGGIAGAEDKAVKVARDQLATLKTIAENTEPIADINTGVFTE